MLNKSQKELLELCLFLATKEYMEFDTHWSCEYYNFFNILPDKNLIIEISPRGKLLWKRTEIPFEILDRLCVEEFIEAIPLNLKKVFLYNLDLFV